MINSVISRPMPPVRRDDPGPTPTGTGPDIDFSSLDSPDKVALLPALNADALLLMYNAIGCASQYGTPFDANLQLSLGRSTTGNVTYHLTDPSTTAVVGQGTIGGQSFNESWQLGQDGIIQITGSIGNAQETLTLSPNFDGLHLDGTVGSQDVHETIRGDGGATRLIFSGNIGAQGINQTLDVDPDGGADVRVSGQLGDLPVDYAGSYVAGSDQQGTLVDGTIAGHDVSIGFDVNMKATPPDAKG